MTPIDADISVTAPPRDRDVIPIPVGISHATSSVEQHQLDSKYATTNAWSLGRAPHEDIFRIAEHVKVGFDDIFSQPEALRTGDIGKFLASPVRRFFSFIFIYTQEAVFYFISIVTGILLGIIWGALFGLLDFIVVWLVQPSIALYVVLLRTLSTPLQATTRTVLDAVFQSLGQSCRYINVRCLNVVSRDRIQPTEWLGFV